MRSARQYSRPALPKRFYRTAEMAAGEAGLALRLDGKTARTPARNPLVVSTPRLAAAIAAEWAGQGEFINPAAMPVTRLANSAIDGVAGRMAEVRDSVVAYLRSDLLCYRAGEPHGLVARQRELWDPILQRAERRHGVRFILSEGVMHVVQPDRTVAALSAEVAGFEDPFALAALQLTTTLTGSALIALALAAGEIGPEEAWTAAHVDEDWNIAQWGVDEEAAARRAARFLDFRAAALALQP